LLARGIAPTHRDGSRFHDLGSIAQ
jgi:hypothetical protein